MPLIVTSASGGRSLSISGPSSRPSNGIAQTERPPVAAPLRRVEIGNAVAVDETHRRVALEELDHLRAVFEQRIDFRRHRTARRARFCRYVRGASIVLDDARARRERIARNPHPAARPRGRAAEHVFLFGDHARRDRASRRSRPSTDRPRRSPAPARRIRESVRASLLVCHWVDSASRHFSMSLDLCLFLECYSTYLEFATFTRGKRHF